MKELLESLRLIEQKTTLYHGSPSDDPRFKIGHTGKNSHTFGDYESTRHGIFLTDNPEFAKLYGEPRQYDVYPQKTAPLDHTDITYNFMKDSEDSDYYQDIKQLVFSNATWEFFEDEVGELFTKWLKHNGYDSARFIEYNTNDNGKELKSNTLVLLDLTKIKHHSGKQLDIYDKIYD